MNLVNIANDGRKLILFCRNEKGEQTISEDSTFYPYYYSLSEEGEFTTFDNKRVKRLFVTHPKEIRERKSANSYESDINYSSRYLVDRIDKLGKCPVKWAMIDVEMLADEFPNPQEAKYPISCIALYNSFDDKIESWYLGDYKTEWEMIAAFINYMKFQCFDLLLIFNGDSFDMPYLVNRNVDFSKKISPVEKARYGTNGMLYPMGTSIVDYRTIDKKMTLNRKKEYSLEARSIEVLGKSRKLKEVDFGKLSIVHKTRCINDVKDMVDMEKKLKYIPLLDGLRRLTKTKFEDYVFNSRYIDQLLLTEARKKKIILPIKPTKEDEGMDFEGAFREAFHRGRHFDKGCYDLAGAYLNAIIELCLDPANVFEEEIENSIPIEVTDRVTNKVVATYYVKQNPEAILPLVAKKLLVEKNKYKKLKNETDPNSPDYKIIEEQYKNWKSLSLSAWGVIGNKYFRYYDYRTTSLITSVIRGLLHFIEEELPKKGYTLEYADTDGIIVDDKGKDISNWLNDLIQEWFQKKFNKSTKILFDYEGNYEKLFIVALTRYRGWLRRPDGTLEEKNVGLEIKRKDSTTFMKQSQKELLELILNKCSKEEAIELIKVKLEEIKNQSLKDISFSCKLARKPEEYATEIKRGNKTFKRKVYITVRALENANLTKKIGQLFFWIYCDNQVPMAFDDEVAIKNVDWAKMKERNIYNKVQVIFEAMGWWKKERGHKFLELFEVVEKKKVKKMVKKHVKELCKTLAKDNKALNELAEIYMNPKEELKKVFKMKYFSMFSGIGGFELGIQKATKDTWDCIGFSEIDEYAIQIYKNHFNHKEYGDAKKIKWNDIEDFEMLVGGFPCQAFSIAGRRRGFDDTRGTLFFEIARAIQEKQPRILLLENVKGLLSHDKGRTFGIILNTLDELGYDLQWQVLNSKNFGVPQNRERVFIVGHLRGTSRPEVFPIGGLAEENKRKIRRRSFDVSGKGYGSQQDRLYNPKGIMACLPNASPDNKILLDMPKIRRLTPPECERLQGFPDGWTEGISDTQRYKCLGNAVTVNVVEEIIKKLLNANKNKED